MALPMWVLNTLQSKMGFPYTTAAIYTFYLIEPSGSMVLCFLFCFVFFSFKRELWEIFCFPWEPGYVFTSSFIK